MTPVQNRGPPKVSEHKILSFSVRKEVIENNNSLVQRSVQSRRKRVPSDFIANLQSRIIILPLFRNAQITDK